MTEQAARTQLDDRSRAEAALMAEQGCGDIDRELIAMVGLVLLWAADESDPHAYLSDFLGNLDLDRNDVTGLAAMVATYYTHAMPGASLAALRVLRGLMRTAPIPR